METRGSADKLDEGLDEKKKDGIGPNPDPLPI
jgi:hypothetical protein